MKDLKIIDGEKNKSEETTSWEKYENHDHVNATWIQNI